MTLWVRGRRFERIEDIEEAVMTGGLPPEALREIKEVWPRSPSQPSPDSERGAAGTLSAAEIELLANQPTHAKVTAHAPATALSAAEIELLANQPTHAKATTPTTVTTPVPSAAEIELLANQPTHAKVTTPATGPVPVPAPTPVTAPVTTTVTTPETTTVTTPATGPVPVPAPTPVTTPVTTPETAPPQPEPGTETARIELLANQPTKVTTPATGPAPETTPVTTPVTAPTQPEPATETAPVPETAPATETAPVPVPAPTPAPATETAPTQPEPGSLTAVIEHLANQPTRVEGPRILGVVPLAGPPGSTLPMATLEVQTSDFVKTLLGFVPITGTAIFWNELSTVEKIIYLGFDAVALATLGLTSAGITPGKGLVTGILKTSKVARVEDAVEDIAQLGVIAEIDVTLAKAAKEVLKAQKDVARQLAHMDQPVQTIEDLVQAELMSPSQRAAHRASTLLSPDPPAPAIEDLANSQSKLTEKATAYVDKLKEVIHKRHGGFDDPRLLLEIDNWPKQIVTDTYRAALGALDQGPSLEKATNRAQKAIARLNKTLENIESRPHLPKEFSSDGLSELFYKTHLADKTLNSIELSAHQARLAADAAIEVSKRSRERLAQYVQGLDNIQERAVFKDPEGGSKSLVAALLELRARAASLHAGDYRVLENTATAIRRSVEQFPENRAAWTPNMKEAALSLKKIEQMRDVARRNLQAIAEGPGFRGGPDSPHGRQPGSGPFDKFKPETGGPGGPPQSGSGGPSTGPASPTTPAPAPSIVEVELLANKPTLTKEITPGLGLRPFISPGPETVTTPATVTTPTTVTTPSAAEIELLANQPTLTKETAPATVTTPTTVTTPSAAEIELLANQPAPATVTTPVPVTTPMPEPAKKTDDDPGPGPAKKTGDGPGPATRTPPMTEPWPEPVTEPWPEPAKKTDDDPGPGPAKKTGDGPGPAPTPVPEPAKKTDDDPEVVPATPPGPGPAKKTGDDPGPATRTPPMTEPWPDPGPGPATRTPPMTEPWPEPAKKTGDGPGPAPTPVPEPAKKTDDDPEVGPTPKTEYITDEGTPPPPGKPPPLPRGKTPKKPPGGKKTPIPRGPGPSASLLKRKARRRQAKYPHLVSFRSGAGWLTHNFDTGHTRYSAHRPPGARSVKPGPRLAERSYTVLQYDDDPPSQSELDRGIMRITVDETGPTFRRRRRKRG